MSAKLSVAAIRNAVRALGNIYVVLRCRIYEGETYVEGMIEYTGSGLSWSGERLTYFTAGMGQDGVNYTGREYADFQCETSKGEYVFELGSHACPIEVTDAQWALCLTADNDFDKKNLAFIVKAKPDPDVMREFEMRGKVAAIGIAANQAREAYRLAEQQLRKARSLLLGPLDKQRHEILEKWSHTAKLLSIASGKCPYTFGGSRMEPEYVLLTEGVKCVWDMQEHETWIEETHHWHTLFENYVPAPEQENE